MYAPMSSPALLSTTEHHAFMSFLHDADADWVAYADLAPPLPHAAASAALAKATQDLIALHPTPRPLPIAPAPAFYPSPPTPRSASTSTLKRPRPLSPPSPPPSPAAASAASAAAAAAAAPQKPTLLSAQQKKANHIQSEQKRRANIRRGYEALCDTVPALRDALRAEEGCPPGRRKRARLDDEKVDGRAGPRSESVVLQKTIEYIRTLRAERDVLLARLERARAVLGPGHPLLAPHTPPLWERNWDGGKGLMTDEQDDDE